jgi:hypothetical protein
MGVTEILIGINTLLIAIAGYLYKKRDDEQESKIMELKVNQEKLWSKLDALEENLNGMKLNYLDRFDSTNKNINRIELSIVKEISILREYLANNFKKKE